MGAKVSMRSYISCFPTVQNYIFLLKKTSGLPIINPHITSKKRKLADRQGEKTVGTIQEKIAVVTEM